VNVFKSFENIGVWLTGAAPLVRYGTAGRLCLTNNNALRGSALCGAGTAMSQLEDKEMAETEGKNLVTGGGLGFFGNDFSVSGTVGTVGAGKVSTFLTLLDQTDATLRHDGMQGTVDARFEMMPKLVVAGGYQFLKSPQGNKMYPTINTKTSAFDLGMSYEISDTVTFGVEGGYHRDTYSMSEGLILEDIAQFVEKIGQTAQCNPSDPDLGYISQACLLAKKATQFFNNDVGAALSHEEKVTTLNIAVPVAFSTQLGSMDVTLSGRPYWSHTKALGTSGNAYGLGLGAQTWAFENTVLSGVQFNYAKKGKKHVDGKGSLWDAAVNVQLFL
jgi:hypothetical protein